ncbi:rod shape-determining protein MreD [Alphaproteobacteria bacterium]|nr:rod shape-determining protein MreD [Alphaproteobacteria bacterium]
MGYEFWGRINQLARGAIPFLLSILLMLIFISSTGIPGFVKVAPSMTIISVYFWSISRPELLPLYLVFGLGLIEDALIGEPLGIQAIVLVLIAYTVSTQRHFFTFAPFGYIFSSFILAAAAGLGVNWLVNSLYYWKFWDITPLLVKAAMTVIFYPVVHWLLAKVDRNIVS